MAHHPNSPMGQAIRQARLMERPVIRAMKRQRNQYDREQQRRETNAEGFAQALAKMLGGIGGATSEAYGNAAGATAGYSKGFSDAEQHLMENEGASLSDFLDKAGIPASAAAGATAKASSPSDVLYGLSGYAPGSTLQREGAAFTGAANQLPGYAAGLGEQNIHQLENLRSHQDESYENQIAAERAKIPALAQQLLQQGVTNSRADQSLQIQKAYLGQRQRAAQQDATGVDPVTGSPKPGYYVDKHGHVLPDGYIWRNGHPVRTTGAAGAGAGIAEFDHAMSTTNDNIYASAKDLVKTIKNTGPLAGLPGHPSTKTQAPAYNAAAKQLFNEYKYLLRSVPRSARPKAKQVLNQTIRQALIAAGIKPPKKHRQPSKPSHPGQNP